jgi:hypothetical protein
MPISEFTPVVEVVPFPGGTFAVRAISLPDVAILIDAHEMAITSIFEKVQNRKQIIDDHGEDEAVLQRIVADMLTELIRESPILIANLIAVCADEPDQMERASRLPVTVQFEALTKIAKLTFTDLASVKKLAADVTAMIRGILPTANTRTAKRK